MRISGKDGQRKRLVRRSHVFDFCFRKLKELLVLKSPPDRVALWNVSVRSGKVIIEKVFGPVSLQIHFPASERNG